MTATAVVNERRVEAWRRWLAGESVASIASDLGRSRKRVYDWLATCRQVMAEEFEVTALELLGTLPDGGQLVEAWRWAVGWWGPGLETLDERDISGWSDHWAAMRTAARELEDYARAGTPTSVLVGPGASGLRGLDR